MKNGSGRTAAHLRDLPVFLRAPRAAGLWLVGVLIPVATVAGFVLSYRGLFDWARYHQWPLYLAPLFPLLIDLLIIAGEVVLFVAAIDANTPRRVRISAWVIVIAFTGLSVAGNVGHAATGDLLTRGGWGLPPVVLAIALGFGLGELKRQASKYRNVSAAASVAVPVKPKLPTWREIQDGHSCSQETAGKIRAALRTRDAQWAQAMDRRGRDGMSASPVLAAAPAGTLPQAVSPAAVPAGAHLNGNGPRGG